MYSKEKPKGLANRQTLRPKTREGEPSPVFESGEEALRFQKQAFLLKKTNKARREVHEQVSEGLLGGTKGRGEGPLNRNRRKRKGLGALAALSYYAAKAF